MATAAKVVLNAQDVKVLRGERLLIATFSGAFRGAYRTSLLCGSYRTSLLCASVGGRAGKLQ